MRFLKTCVSYLLSAFLALQAGNALAQPSSVGAASQETPKGIAARYPAGSITTVEAADAALAEMDRKRKEAEARYAAEESACHPKFFSTSCIEQAKERRREALSQIRKVELEANAVKRQERARERDEAVAEKQSKAEADRAERERLLLEKPKKDSAPAETQDAERNARLPVHTDRAAQHEAKMKRLQEAEQAKEKRRAEKVAEYEKKVKASQERQKKIAERKAKKEAKQKAKQEQDPAAPPAAN